MEYLEFCNKHALSNWWFRGVSDVNHELIPKVGREYPNDSWNKPLQNGIAPVTYEKRVFTAFKRRAQLELGGVVRSDLEWLAIAQHNGVPTRLLDWTPNPLTAAWFSIDCPTKPEVGQTARVYAVKVTTDISADPFKLDPFKIGKNGAAFVISPHWHPRVRAQRGCFTVHSSPNKPVDLSSLEHNSFDIPAKHWRAFRRRLFYFGY